MEAGMFPQPIGWEGVVWWFGRGGGKPVSHFTSHCDDAPFLVSQSETCQSETETLYGGQVGIFCYQFDWLVIGDFFTLCRLMWAWERLFVVVVNLVVSFPGQLRQTGVIVGVHSEISQSQAGLCLFFWLQEAGWQAPWLEVARLMQGVGWCYTAASTLRLLVIGLRPNAALSQPVCPELLGEGDG